MGDGEKFPAEICRMTVGEVASVGQIHGENWVAIFQHGEINGGIGLGTGVRLDVDVIGPKQFLGAIDGEVLGLIHGLASPIPAFSRITFGVFVGQHGSLSFAHESAGEIFRSDQLDVVLLAVLLFMDDCGDGGIAADQAVHFIDPALMPSTFKGGTEVGGDDFLRIGCGQRGSRHANHIGVVMLAGGGGRRCIMEESSLNSGKTVGGDAHAHAGGANQDTQIRLAFEDGIADATSEVRVINTVVGMGARIHDGVSGLRQKGD